MMSGKGGVAKMSETRIQVPPGFNDLSKAEQVRYFQDLWDLIADSPGDIPIPERHLELAEARLRRYREDPTRASSAFEVLDRLSKKPK
jgi:putative addiction module component (TIGR02574 family)